MAELHIDSLRCQTTIGIHDWEQSILQPVILSFSFNVNSNITTLNEQQDYGALCRAIREHLQSKKTKLLETLATDMFDFIEQFTSSSSLKLKITKPGAISECNGVSIVIESNAK